MKQIGEGDIFLVETIIKYKRRNPAFIFYTFYNRLLLAFHFAFALFFREIVTALNLVTCR